MINQVVWLAAAIIILAYFLRQSGFEPRQSRRNTSGQNINMLLHN